MKKQYRKINLLLSLMLVIVLCGFGDTKTDTKNLGACNFTMSGLKGCTESVLSGKLAPGPVAEAVSSVKSSCGNELKGSFAAGGVCSRKGAAGICTLKTTETQGTETYTVTLVTVYSTGFTPTTAAVACAESQGNFSTR